MKPGRTLMFLMKPLLSALLIAIALAGLAIAFCCVLFVALEK